MKYNDLSNIPLEELHILKTHAFETLAKLERLLGNRRDIKSYDAQDFKFWAELYLKMEEEMNSRIVSTVINNVK